MNVSKIIYIVSIVVLVNSASTLAAPKSKLIEFWNDFEPGSRLTIKHDNWDALLKKHVRTNHPSGINRVNYAGFSADDKVLLSQYLAYLQQMDPRQLSREHQKAYWLNFYNAAIVSLIVEDESADSVKDLGRIWKKKRFYIAMQETSLDNIQHGVLRPMFGDKRALLAINAGTLGSASIQPMAFTNENVETLLDKIVRGFLAHPNGLQVKDDKLILSKTFRWYASDFGDRQGLLEFISEYAPKELALSIAQVDSVSYQYDWTINKP